MSGAGFRRYAGAGSVVWLAEPWADELEPLELTAPGALARWRRGAPAVPGGRARGWRIRLASGRDVHLREMAHGGWLRGLTGRRFLGLRRAGASLETAAALVSRRVPVPGPVALHGQRRGPFWHVSVANEFVPDACPGGSFLAARSSRADPGAADIACEMAAAAARAIRAFHDAGASHPDLHIDNLLVRNAPGGCEVVIVDLDRVRLGAPPSPTRREAELARLVRSLRHGSLGASARQGWEEALRAAYAQAGSGRG